MKFAFYFNGEEGLRRSQMDRAWMVIHVAGGGQATGIHKSQSPKAFRFIFKVKIGHLISLHEVWQSPCRFSVPLDLRSNYNIQIIKINKNLCIRVWKMSFSFIVLIETNLARCMWSYNICFVIINPTATQFFFFKFLSHVSSFISFYF